MTYHNGGDPVYAPNSYGGPAANPALELPTWSVQTAEIICAAYPVHRDDDDFGQAGTWCARSWMTRNASVSPQR